MFANESGLVTVAVLGVSDLLTRSPIKEVGASRSDRFVSYQSAVSSELAGKGLEVFKCKNTGFAVHRTNACQDLRLQRYDTTKTRDLLSNRSAETKGRFLDTLGG